MLEVRGRVGRAAVAPASVVSAQGSISPHLENPGTDPGCPPDGHISKLVALSKNVLSMEYKILEVRSHAGRAVEAPATVSPAARFKSIHLSNPGMDPECPVVLTYRNW